MFDLEDYTIRFWRKEGFKQFAFRTHEEAELKQNYPLVHALITTDPMLRQGWLPLPVYFHLNTGSIIIEALLAAACLPSNGVYSRFDSRRSFRDGPYGGYCYIDSYLSHRCGPLKPVAVSIRSQRLEGGLYLAQDGHFYVGEKLAHSVTCLERPLFAHELRVDWQDLNFPFALLHYGDDTRLAPDVRTRSMSDREEEYLSYPQRHCCPN